MKKNLALLSLATLILFNSTAYSAEEVKKTRMAKIGHEITVKTIKAILYGAPLFLGILAASKIKDKTTLLDGSCQGIHKRQIAEPFLIGVFAAYCWPLANKIK